MQSTVEDRGVTAASSPGAPPLSTQWQGKEEAVRAPRYQVAVGLFATVNSIVVKVKHVVFKWIPKMNSVLLTSAFGIGVRPNGILLVVF